MNKHIALAIGALGVSMGAQAAITVANGSLGPNFLDLTQPGVVAGGSLYTAAVSQPPGGPFVAAIPYDASPLPGITTDALKGWIAAGPSHSNGTPVTLTLPTGTTAVSFLWGSPDGTPSEIINTLTVNSTGGSFIFTVATANIPVTNGDQNEAFYRTFTTDTGTISSLVFANNNINAFEASNVTVVPEPEAYGLALAGMGVVAFAMRRRRPA